MEHDIYDPKSFVTTIVTMYVGTTRIFFCLIVVLCWLEQQCTNFPHMYFTLTLLIYLTQLTGTVSHVLGKATFDSSYQEEREQIVESAQSGGGYFMAGLMGFTGGVFSGITSMVTQPYKGAQESGIGVRDNKNWHGVAVLYTL